MGERGASVPNPGLPPQALTPTWLGLWRRTGRVPAHRLDTASLSLTAALGQEGTVCGRLSSAWHWPDRGPGARTRVRLAGLPSPVLGFLSGPRGCKARLADGSADVSRELSPAVRPRAQPFPYPAPPASVGSVPASSFTPARPARSAPEPGCTHPPLRCRLPVLPPGRAASLTTCGCCKPRKRAGLPAAPRPCNRRLPGSPRALFLCMWLVSQEPTANRSLAPCGGRTVRVKREV